MSEASSDFRPRPALPATPRRVRSVPRAGAVDDRVQTIDPASAAPPYPLDPPLVEVRIPVRAPHANATGYSRNVLRNRFPGAEVGDDLHMLFTEPDKTGRSRLAPDVLVALNVPRSPTRGEYDADLLGPPDFVLEVLSRSTWIHDVGRKLNCYQQIGVRECLLFDVTGEDLAGVGKDIWGFALTPKRREPLAECVLPTGEHGVRSEMLGLVAYVAERTPPSASRETWALTMRWHDPTTGADIRDYDQTVAGEALALAGQAQARAEATQVRADATHARADATQARAEAAQARDDAAQARDDAAQARAETQAERAKVRTERARAEAALRGEEAALRREEATRRRNAELEEELRRLRGEP